MTEHSEGLHTYANPLATEPGFTALMNFMLCGAVPPVQGTPPAPAKALKRFSVRKYYTYVDEYNVLAVSAQAAIKLTDQWESVCDPSQRDPALDAVVEQTAQNEYVDHDQTCVSELDEDGNWLDAD
jgi:hypothetical protein